MKKNDFVIFTNLNVRKLRKGYLVIKKEILTN